MTDWEYWKIDGRSADIKVVVKTPNEKDEVFYFAYWDDAWKWYLLHSRYYKELGIRKLYEFNRRFYNKSWFCAEAHKNY